MSYVPLSTRITPGVDRRLRMLALAESKPLSHLLDGLLDAVLPPADKLASRLGDNSGLLADDECQAVA